MSEKRKDSKGRILRDGENQMKDGCYRYQYMDCRGKRCAVYSWKLVETDRTLPGKRGDISLREKIKQIDQDVEGGIKTAANNKIPLNDMFDLYMAGKYELKDSTRSNYLYMYENYVSDEIGRKKVASIKYSDVKAFYNSLIRKKGFKPNSIAIINTILYPVFALAVRDGYIRSNPTDGVMAEIKKSHNWEKPKSHALTEQEAFIEFISNSDIYRHWLPLFTVFLGTGCRVGEIIGLRWQDLDFESRTISINYNLIYRVYRQQGEKCEMHITTPKTSAGSRTIPMLDEVRRALLQEKWQQMQRGYNETVIDGYSSFIFTNREDYVHNPQTINRAIKRIYTAYNEQEKEGA